MKEAIYGWYPSVKDVYRPKGRPSSYHLECLYKHKDSLYFQPQVAPPQPELMVRGCSPSPVAPSPKGMRRMRSKTMSVPKFSPVPKLNIPTPTQCWAAATQKRTSETTWGVVGDPSTSQAIHMHPGAVNWPLPTNEQQQHHHHQQQQRLDLQYSPQAQTLTDRIQRQQEKYYGQKTNSPQLAWGFRKAQTARETPTAHPLCVNGDELKWPPAQDAKPERPQSSSNAQTPRSPKQPQRSRPNSSPVRSLSRGQCQGQKIQGHATPTPPQATKTPVTSGRPARIQSATIRRERTPMPSRPMTATSARKQPSPEVVVQETKAPSPPACQAPSPFIYDVNDHPYIETSDAEEGGVVSHNTTLEDDYDDMLNKYGWRAEVHGDPYKLKRPLPRMSYAVECPVPEVPPEPPGVHMETNEPFFLNTIPNKPMVFSVDKEWMSEVILAKRLELQKRDGGIKYSYKNFSFVY